MAPIPDRILLYHIVHVDRLPSIIEDGFLWSDREVRERASPGTAIGMSHVKERRLRTSLTSHPTLMVGSCVPFYFSARSEMLYMIHRANNDDILYRGGQEEIVHLVFDMYDTVDWAKEEGLRWAFTLSGAGSVYFEDRADLAHLDEIDWKAVETRRWSGPDVDNHLRDRKKAEFLMEDRMPWSLLLGIGVCSERVGKHVAQLKGAAGHSPPVKVWPRWYY